MALTAGILSIFLSAADPDAKLALPKSSLAATTLETSNDAMTTLRRSRFVEGPHIGEGGEPSKVYEAFVFLSKNATDNELTYLLADTSPVVRHYAFRAITSRFPEHVVFDLLMKHIGDETPVNVVSFDMFRTSKLADLFFSAAVTRLSEIDKESLQSWLLETPNGLAARSWALSERPVRVKFYPAIKRLAEQKVSGALTALASTKDEKFVPLIKEHLSSGSFFAYKAVTEFPNDAFFPILAGQKRRMQKCDSWSNEQSMYFRAVASYENKAAAEILESTLRRLPKCRMSKYSIWFAYQAAAHHRVPSFSSFLFKAWELLGITLDTNFSPKDTRDLVLYLVSIDEPRALAAMKNHLMTVGQRFETKELGRVGENSGLGLYVMAGEYVRRVNPKKSEPIISRAVKNANVHQLAYVAKIVIENRLTNVIPALFFQIEHNANPYNRLFAAEALLAFNSDKINQRLRSIVATQEKLDSTWGTEALEYLLEHPESPRWIEGNVGCLDDTCPGSQYD